jgi:nitrogen regulatory protein P-II 1
MKMVLAIIRPARLEAVKEALSEVGVTGMTVVDVQGAGRQRGHVEVYRGREYNVNLMRKIELQIALEDDVVETVIETLARAARTGDEGSIGDGKIFILEMPEVVRIRTGERGPEAL